MAFVHLRVPLIISLTSVAMIVKRLQAAIHNYQKRRRKRNDGGIGQGDVPIDGFK